MLTVKNKENKNYLAKVVAIDKLVSIEGADNIQIAVIDFQDVVVSKNVKKGDLMVYFPSGMRYKQGLLGVHQLIQKKRTECR